MAQSKDPKKESLLAEEAAEYKDIVQGDFVDSFRNLTVKDIMFMRWMKAYCSQAKFVFKVSFIIRFLDFKVLHGLLNYSQNQS